MGTVADVGAVCANADAVKTQEIINAMAFLMEEIVIGDRF
jgi:hypothetical protein